MYGLLIVEPKDLPSYTWKNGYRFEREYHYLSSEIDSNWHTVAFFKEHHSGTHFPLSIPDYNPQYFLLNGNSGLLPELMDTIKAQGDKNTLLRLANVGFEANYYVFPERLKALVVSSDGRPLPKPTLIDTLHLFPGERYQVLLQPETDAFFDEKIVLQYYALHNHKDLYKRDLLVRVDDFSGLGEGPKPELELFPNPVIDQLHIQLNSAEKVKASVFNLAGEVVFEEELWPSAEFLDLSELKSSMYTIEVQLKNGLRLRESFFKAKN